MRLKELNEFLATLEWVAVDEQSFADLSEDEQLRRIRHSSSHVMADAVGRLYPNALFAIGPATSDGFFYDIKLESPLDESSLKSIEELMSGIAAEMHPFETAQIDRESAMAVFEAKCQKYKLEILERIRDATITLYRHGTFVDLCAGPHAPHTGCCRHVRLLAMSASHWRQESTPSLTRLRGTAWKSHRDLKTYLRFTEEAKARDHRILGPALDLFTFHEWAASALWAPDGFIFRTQLMDYWRELMEQFEYVEISNPLLYKKELFETSGHWDHFQENVFAFRDDDGNVSWVLKPMNCPDTMLYFRSRNWSYRDLPLRIAESQVLHRNELSGTIHGIMRTRNFQQDDAHIFLSEEHIEGEVLSLLELIDRIYGLLGLKHTFTLSTRPEGFLGDEATWEGAEKQLRHALEKKDIAYSVDEGGGAFYGPKIDVNITDSLGRQWQCGTIQLDFQLPERFDLHFTASDGSRQRPIVVHRAIFGSYERFLGVLIEHFNGRFPTWLAPIQAVVLPISEAHEPYAREVASALRAKRIRGRIHDDGSLNSRVRSAEKKRASYILVVGNREVEARSVSVRRHGQNPRVLALDKLIDEIKDHIVNRTLDVDLEAIKISSPPGMSMNKLIEKDSY